MAMVIAVFAKFVADWECADCARTPSAGQVTECADRSRTYGDALYWLLNRLSGGDPEELGARTHAHRQLRVFSRGTSACGGDVAVRRLHVWDLRGVVWRWC
jgi:hypothetical protein